MNVSALRARLTTRPEGASPARTYYDSTPVPVRWGAGAVLLAAAAHVGTHGMAVFWFPLAAVAAAGGVWWWQHRKAAHGDHLLLWALAGAWVLIAAHAGPLAFDGVLQVMLVDDRGWFRQGPASHRRRVGALERGGPHDDRRGGPGRAARGVRPACRTRAPCSWARSFLPKNLPCGTLTTMMPPLRPRSRSRNNCAPTAGGFCRPWTCSGAARRRSSPLRPAI